MLDDCFIGAALELNSLQAEAYRRRGWRSYILKFIEITHTDEHILKLVLYEEKEKRESEGGESKYEELH